MTFKNALDYAYLGGWKKRNPVIRYWEQKFPVVKEGVHTTETQMISYNDTLDEYGTVMDIYFWKGLGKYLGWGKPLKDENGTCLHCGTNWMYQPEDFEVTGCQHVHYPDACKVCTQKSKSPMQHQIDMIKFLWSGGKISGYFERL